MTPNPKPQDDGIDGPAKVDRLHVQDRSATDKNMRPITGTAAWSKWTPLEAAFKNGKLGAVDSGDAWSRYQAGMYYAKVWDTAQSAGRDSTQALNVSRSSGGGSISQAQSDSIKALVAIESHLGQRDRIIIRNVCGLGCFPAEAVALVSPLYAKATIPRFNEALDALIEAIRDSKGGVYYAQRKP